MPTNKKSTPAPAPTPEADVETLRNWTGFAVAHGDQLLIDTVMPTRRGAIVNYLMVYCGHVVTADDQDYQIDTAFDLHVQRGFDKGVDVYVADVTIGKTEAELRAEGFVGPGEDDSDESEAA